jgi:predicted RNase H-like HicB family nuclease
MKSYKVVVAIERQAGGKGYSAYSPTLPGCFSNGKTVQEARRNIRVAIQQHVESLLAHGQPLPDETRVVHSEVATVRVPAMPRSPKPRGESDASVPDPVYQLRIALQDVEPPVWRRVRVGGRTMLPRVHTVIQKAMGWQNAHLHEFVIRGVRYGERMPDEPEYEVEPERSLPLRVAASTEGMHFEYLYDFGDSWRHDILVEKIEVPAEPLRHPVCLAGERACPPEDCGGPPGYMELVEILGDPDHEEYGERREWSGGSFDPEAFNLAAANRRLRQLK